MPGKLISLLFLSFSFFMLIGCGTDAVFEDEHLFSDSIWAYDNAQEFEFEVSDTTVPYEMYYSLRYSIDYEHCNIFVKYALLNEGDTLNSGMKEGVLLDCKNGSPAGNRIGENIFNQELPLINNLRFSEKGKYKLVLRHFMRDDSLKNIFAAGVSLKHQELQP